MGKKLLKYGIALLILLVLGYNSVYFKKLSEVKAAVVPGRFDAFHFSQQLWEEQLPAKLDSAVDLNTLLSLLKINKAEAFSKYSNALHIGNTRYFLVKAAGIVTNVNEDEVILQSNKADSTVHIQIETEFVYGNAIRDASGLVDIKDFTNATDLNAISEELNKQVRKNVLPPFKSAVKKGSLVEVVGVVEMNQEHVNTKEIEIIPLRIKIVQ